MHLTISSIPAEWFWGEKALLSTNKHVMTIHLIDNDPLIAIQKAGRIISKQGIREIALIGDAWNLNRCWAFWQGFYSPKKESCITWPILLDKDRKELNDRIKVVDWVRHTINTPADELGPEQLVQNTIGFIFSIAKNDANYRILAGKSLLDNRYLGLYSVGRSSDRNPVLLTIDYNPSGDTKTPTLFCLVGKGVTFDTGGYHLKNSVFMNSMKSDMSGAAMLTGALALAICRGLKKRVQLILCCTDNMINGNALKAGDIIHYRNGKSVEVMNTDAEGRLILADGLIDASLIKPKFIVDCATLTSAAKIALGNDYHALFSFDEILAKELIKSAREEHEYFWRLPLAEMHRCHLSSNFADISNVTYCNSTITAGASIAAAFLSFFIENYRCNWLHIDCSASYYEKEVEKWSAGSTGLGVCTLANFLLAKEKD
ncbi:aminopeptidase PepB [Sodalis sp. CWE]|uniref:aminopeptidase PepB n=1 Tax=Sodalis sp. CWE TaxID=2803816 RepID=UPI001C7CEA1B|nr:aminopeptidase PepB [Sodalis sp. CWE]MBX4181016.1 aminopeptidase PepB [Sodalis sp. CWE]